MVLDVQLYPPISSWVQDQPTVEQLLIDITHFRKINNFYENKVVGVLNHYVSLGAKTPYKKSM